MDNGYGLKMSNLSSNSGLIELEKNKRPVEKLGSEMMSSKKNVNQIEIVMEPEYMNVFSLEDDWTTIGDEESIEINGKTIEFNLPDLQKWTSEYLWQVLVPCESGEKTIEEINKSFDWKNFHKRGLELAHKVKKLLPENVRLRYVAPFEDRSGIIDGEMWVE